MPLVSRARPATCWEQDTNVLQERGAQYIGGRALSAASSEPALSARLYAVLRERIIRGHYPQGGRLPEARIGEEFAVSRVPMRETLPLLERDGFVSTSPRRGAVVVEWTERAALDLLDVRSWFEPAAAARAAERVAAGADPASLDHAIAAAERAASSSDLYAVTIANVSFHDAVVETTANELLAKLSNTLSGRITWLLYLTGQLDLDWVLDDHRALRDAIVAGDVEAADGLARAHVERDRRLAADAVRATA